MTLDFLIYIWNEKMDLPQLLCNIIHLRYVNHKRIDESSRIPQGYREVQDRRSPISFVMEESILETLWVTSNSQFMQKLSFKPCVQSSWSVYYSTSNTIVTLVLYVSFSITFFYWCQNSFTCFSHICCNYISYKVLSYFALGLLPTLSCTNIEDYYERYDGCVNMVMETTYCSITWSILFFMRGITATNLEYKESLVQAELKIDLSKLRH